MKRTWTTMGFTLAVCALAGCNVDFGYLLPAAGGQLEILTRMVPVERALESGNLSEQQRAKLLLIQDVRTFAGEVLGLSVGENYATFYDAGGEPVAFNISASRRDAFVPRLWDFPIVGTVPYLGYFDRTLADQRFRELEADGLDVFMYQIDAYSGLGFYPNPILSPMLDRNEINLVDTVIHELLHATIWRAGDTPFNESLATFFGRTGAMQYFADRFPDEPERLAEVTGQFADIDRFSEFALSVYEELDAYYRSDLASQAKIAGRAAVYQAGSDRFARDVLPHMSRPDLYEWAASLPVNNAYLLGIRRYNLDLEVFEDVFAASGNDWTTAVLVFRMAAQASDPYAAMRAWLAGDQQRPEASKAVPSNSGKDPTPERIPGRCARCAATTLTVPVAGR